MPKSLTYGNTTQEYIAVRSQRRSLVLQVSPEQEILIKAPLAATDAEIENFLRRKWLWLEDRLKEFGQYQKTTYQKRYLAGESLYYLGRQYIIKVSAGSKDQVKLTRKTLELATTQKLGDREWNSYLIRSWLGGRRIRVFQTQFFAALKKFNYSFTPSLKIKLMPKRWGSCSLATKTIYLNPRLIEAPTEAIYYVCIHELTHFKYKNHDANFYRYLSARLPSNWQAIKNDLQVRFGGRG